MTDQTQTAPFTDSTRTQYAANDSRSRLLAAVPARERSIDLAGMPTAYLEGGEGEPVVLLHGPGETSLWWMRVIPKLMKTHRVIVPDLPGHGETRTTGDAALDENIVLQWLDELIERTCEVAPTLVGHILGGSIAARYTIRNGEKLDRLVLVNSLGLGKFRPAPRFALGLIRFMVWPTRKNYERFLPQCLYDPDALGNKMGETWEHFLDYTVACAQDPDKKEAMQVLMKTVGVPEIPTEELQKIDIPTYLVWGRLDRANKLKIAEEANERYGWPLQIIDETRDDPKLERPEAVTEALRKCMENAAAGG